MLTERDRQIYLAQAEQTAQTVQAAQDSQHAPDLLHQVSTEVQEQALVLAGQLRKEGFTRNDCIGIAADVGGSDSAHDAHLLVAFLAIRQLGACAYIINSTTNPLRRQALLDAAGVVRVLETVDTSHIPAVNEVVEEAEDAGKLVEITGESGTTAPVKPVTPDAGQPVLRFSIQHASGHLLLAELDQTAFLRAVLRFTGQRAVGQGTTEQVLLSALQAWSRPLSVQQLAQFFPVTVLEGRQLAPVGSAGELSLAGIHLCASAATVRQTGLTVPHPLFPAQTLIRTGHRVILRQDGSCHADPLSVQNRARRRGQWARQSETLLRSVIPKQLPTLVLQQTQWIAFTQAHAGTVEAEMTLAALLARLKQTPQRHWLPSALQIWDSLPLLDQGAVDRELLKKSSDGNGKLFIPPQGPTEELLAAIWSELLPAHNTERTELAERQIDRRDNFFLIGGYSLIAAQLIARIRDLFQVELPLRELFAHQTLQSQARLIDQQRHSEEAQLPHIVAIPRDATAPLPLSFSQQRLWFLSRMMPPNAVYNIPFALRLRGKVDESALVHSLNAIISRHEALRTRFADVDGQAVQLIDPPGRPCVVVEDIDSEAALHSRILAERHYCFDLSNEPLVRLRVLNTRFDGHHVLLATFHHIVADGWSMGVFFKELVELYRTTVAAPGAQITPLAPLRLQFADYAHWQRQQLTGNIIAAQLSYWEHQLAGLPPLLDLP
ncbi:condensation domain-containing protein, partial [Undibacterium sp. TJN19]|uniref:condensation domain-containing protein n=1 Tax=Undibacterium sp. TJN19 TaxID=3413055 RepID=UPI003BF00DED